MSAPFPKKAEIPLGISSFLFTMLLGLQATYLHLPEVSGRVIARSLPDATEGHSGLIFPNRLAIFDDSYFYEIQ